MLRNISSVMSRNLFFSTFIGIVFLNHYKIINVFYALSLKVFPKYLLLIKYSRGVMFFST